MLHVREVSDLHLEFDDEFMRCGPDQIKEKLTRLIPILPTDKKTVLIVAGDLAGWKQSARILLFFEHVLKRFKHVIYVLGNHEHYYSRINLTRDAIELFLKKRLSQPELFEKLTVAGNEPVKKEIGGVTFLCATLWTDYGKHRTEVDKVHKAVAWYIADHRCIVKADSDGILMPADLVPVFDATVAKFDEWMTELGDNGKTIVATHHLPTFQAVHPQYCLDEESRRLNHAFASNLDSLILKHQPAIWFFGHTHIPYYGKIGNTQLHCNPYGYPHEATAKYSKYDSTKVYSL